jgi:two-component system, LytTR family, response regulator
VLFTKACGKFYFYDLLIHTLQTLFKLIMNIERKTKQNLKAILVDDEAPANTALQALLEMTCPDVNIVEVCESTAKAMEAIIRHQPDVLFLDIQMPHESGIDFLKRLGKFDFEVIFVTAFNQYAIDAFKLSAVDYVLKPVNAADVTLAIEKVSKRRQEKRKLEQYQILFEHIQGNTGRMMLPNKNGLYEVVRIPEIYYCKADGHTTHFFLTEKRHLITGSNLGEYKTALLAYQFMQTHRSYIVNMSFVDKFNGQDEFLLLKNGQNIPIGKDYKNAVVQWLKG